MILEHTMCSSVTCKVHKSERRGDSYMRVTFLLYNPVQKVITLRDLQKVFSDVEHWALFYAET